MAKSLSKSLYSQPFHVLFYLGAWTFKAPSYSKLVIYSTYQVIITMLAAFGFVCVFGDLILEEKTFEKTTWRVCITFFYGGSVFKNFTAYTKSQIINALRLSLHKDVESRKSPEDLAIERATAKEYKMITIFLYSLFFLVYPILLLAKFFSYLWGPREFPFPFRFPVEIDVNDEVLYNLFFFLTSLFGFLDCIFVLHIELAMFGLLMQISREYRVLLKDIAKLKDIYEAANTRWCDKTTVFNREINPWLRKLTTKILLKEFLSRQNKIIRYTLDFEECYNFLIIVQFFVISVLIICAAIVCLLTPSYVQLPYMLGFLIVTVLDTFALCFYSTNLENQCKQVGIQAYSLPWYLMDLDAQKYIIMMIARSQNPPILTAGKMVELNLNTFVNLMKNIYGWLTLFDQMQRKE